MSQDWKKRYEADLARQRQEAARAEEASRAAQEAAERREYQRKLPEHQRRFRCHVCGKPSSGPGSLVLTDFPGDDTLDWNIPTDLWYCQICKKLTCSDCMYDGICRKDAGY